jgi:outer membrane protein assembly factor BamB
VEAAPRAVDELVRDSGVAAGLVVHLGTTDGQLETALAQGGRRLVHGLAADEDRLRTARKTIEDAGLYGLASVVEHRGKERLPYRDNLVDLLVVSDWDAWAKKGITEDELLRVVVPQGVLCLWRDGKWDRRIKPRPAEMDQWRNQKNAMAGALISRDAAFKAPFELRWVDGPHYGSAVIKSPTQLLISAGGKTYMLTELDVMNFGKAERTSVLVARNAFNGIRLWSDSKRNRNINGICAAGPHLFEAQDSEIVAYDSNNGEQAFVIRAAGRVSGVSSDGEALYVASFTDKRLPVMESFAVRAGEAKWKVEGVGGGFRIGGDTIYVLGTNDLVALDSKTGKQRWTAKSEGPVSLQFLCRGTIVVASKELVAAYSTQDGARLWSAPVPPPNLPAEQRGRRVVVPWKNGVAICGNLHDPSTGKVIGSAPKALNGNCTPPVVTPNFIIPRGLTFTYGPEPADAFYFAGLRTQCGDGAMVANGMLYSGPTLCGCDAGGRLDGFPAFGTAGVQVKDEDFSAARPVLTGPGGNKPFTMTDGDWPTYRHDATRSSCAPFSMPPQLKLLWKKRLSVLPQGTLALNWLSKIAAGLTAPTIAGGMVYVADSETHRILAVSAADGQTRWTFRADARVDAPPTIYQGRCLFGSRDGWVYCLRADDGQLVWRSRAAPAEQYVAAYGQLESAWPVPGCVAVEKNLVYATAGRTYQVDGGIAFCAFRLEDGSTAWARKKGYRNDIPVSDGNQLYVGGFLLSSDAAQPVITKGPPRPATPPWQKDHPKGRILEGGRIGLLDPLTTLFPPWPWNFSALGAPPGKFVMGCKYPAPVILAVWDCKSEEVFTYHVAGGRETGFKAGPLKLHCMKVPNKKGEKPTDNWTVELPKDTRVDGMMVTADALLLSGVTGADASPKGVLWTYSRDEGKKQQKVALPGIPAFQSLSAMPGRIFVTTTDGHLVCLGE